MVQLLAKTDNQMTPCMKCGGPVSVTAENIVGTATRCDWCGLEEFRQRSDIRTVSYSEISSARRCAFQHQLGYHERWAKPRGDEMSPSAIGTAWHLIMESHYKMIQDYQREAAEERGSWQRFNHRNALESAENLVEDDIRQVDSLEAQNLLRWMYGGYVLHHGADPLWRILDVEVSGHTLLYPGEATAMKFRDAVGFNLKYRIDLMIEFQGKTWIVDHKSFRNAPSQLDLDFDPQFDLYTWAMRNEGVPVFGQIYNGTRRYRTQKPQPLSERHVRQMTHRNDTELDTIARDAYLSIRTRYDQQEMFDGLGVDSPRSPDSRGCNHLCDFKEPCLLGRKGIPLRPNLQARGFVQNFERH